MACRGCIGTCHGWNARSRAAAQIVSQLVALFIAEVHGENFGAGEYGKLDHVNADAAAPEDGDHLPGFNLAAINHGVIRGGQRIGDNGTVF